MDHQITGAVSKNFRTKGRMVVEEGGFLFNTETTAHTAVIKGRFLGKLLVEQTLEIHRTADIKGTFRAGRMFIPAGHAWRWTDRLTVTDADIAGEFVGHVQATGTFTIRSSGRFFGDLEAAHLVVENGAIVVGQMKIKPPPAA
jgi:cytoskeletal protein CcmA (bactofilin family)